MYGGGGGGNVDEVPKQQQQQQKAAAAGKTRKELKRSVSMGVGGRLASAAREQRARLYIMRRCVSMLVRWKD
ncbi:hypothetical protein ACP4OV_002147 [Aristida adscensionis]